MLGHGAVKVDGRSVAVDEFFDATTREGSSFCQLVDEPQLGQVASHTLVELDQDGKPLKDSFLYVDEGASPALPLPSNVTCRPCAMAFSHMKSRMFSCLALYLSISLSDGLLGLVAAYRHRLHRLRP